MSEDSEEQYFLFGCSGKFTVGPISVVGWLKAIRTFALDARDQWRVCNVEQLKASSKVSKSWKYELNQSYQ